MDGGGVPADVVAALSEFVPFVADSNSFTNTVDAALAEIDPELAANINNQIWTAALPLATAKPVRGMNVSKRGRTTGDTTSVVTDVNFRVMITYPDVGVVGFTDQVLCKNYTAPGDSGALVTESGTGMIVGLHFAGSPRASIFTPIETVMNALNFSF